MVLINLQHIIAKVLVMTEFNLLKLAYSFIWLFHILIVNHAKLDEFTFTIVVVPQSET